MTNFNIKIVSDTVCPWCYVGKKRLDRAITLYQRVVPGGSSDTFTVTWHPFYLDPTSPTVGVPLPERMAQKFGADRVQALNVRLKQIGSSEGINFGLNGKIGNTRDAHRLVQLGKTKGNAMENAVMAALFTSYFEQDGDITSRDMLVAAGVKAGLVESEARRWLEEGKGGEEVDREVEEAYAKGIHGVPNFTINGKYTIDGAQDVEAFIAEFVRAKENADGVSNEQGGSC